MHRRYFGAAISRSLLAGLVAVLATLLMAAPSTARSSAPAPPGFFGVVPQGSLGVGDLDRAAGLGLVARIPVYWYEVETTPGAYDFSALDRELGAAADAGVRVLPVLYGSPAWIGTDPAVPPVRTAEALARWGAFVSALVSRYGSAGSFWEGRARRLPVTRWQIWNEPNFPVFWEPRPEPDQYARLLHTSAAAIHGLDPRAKVVAAAVAPISHEIKPWQYLRQLYRVPGFRRDADIVALHPYSTDTAQLAESIQLTRTVMADAHDAGTPLLITEFGVASHSLIPTLFNLGPAGQARYLEQAYGLLVRQRRRWNLAGAYWYTWRDEAAPDPYCTFCEGAGLFELDGTPKPSWRALRRVVSRYGR